MERGSHHRYLSFSLCLSSEIQEIKEEVKNGNQMAKNFRVCFGHGSIAPITKLLPKEETSSLHIITL